MDDNVLPFSELPAYLQAVEEEEEKKGGEQGGKGGEKKNGATPLFGTNRPGTADNHHDFTGHTTQLSDYSHCNNMDLIVKCSSFHVCQYASLEVPPLYCDTCGDEVEGNTHRFFHFLHLISTGLYIRGSMFIRRFNGRNQH